ncbi:putative adhesin [Umezawaea sp. Da 62-37]|uniref:putative adhesin n=1 Tax=Umezawaea sp. Da 62-37 TaxID=3075927 RepID=UPI0028F6C716|nr:hypothetical protein [Umezawaea sp. Da 62-37]WNV87990.1 hypothetical protein RM788_06800 [Umezawaea sp. Da 62-37]
MPEAFVLGHGGHYGSSTFVPEGTTVHFYSDVDTALLVTASLAGLSGGGALARETVAHDPSGAGEVANYVLTAHRDQDMALYLATRPPEPSAVLCFVGHGPSPAPDVHMLDPVADGLPLCTSPVDCLASWPRHTCRGLFTALPRSVDVVHLLCCRTPYAGPHDDVTVALGGEETRPHDRQHRVGRKFAARDERLVPATTAKARSTTPLDLESLPQATRAQLISAHPDLLDTWQHIQGHDPVNFPHIAAARAFHPGEDPPESLVDGWLDEDWRNAFWAFCHADGTAPVVAARLLAFDAVTRCLDGSTANDVLSSAVVERLRTAGVGAEYSDSLEEALGDLHRLLVLRDNDDDGTWTVVRSLTAGTRDAFGVPDGDEDARRWLDAFRSDPDRHVDELLGVVHAVLRMVGELLLTDLTPLYDEFRWIARADSGDDESYSDSR